MLVGGAQAKGSISIRSSFFVIMNQTSDSRTYKAAISQAATGCRIIPVCLEDFLQHGDSLVARFQRGLQVPAFEVQVPSVAIGMAEIA